MVGVRMNGGSDKLQRPERKVTVIGWMEYVDLPNLGLKNLKAKIDTGARTSAIHAHDITLFRRDDADWVRFRTDTENGEVGGWIESPVHETRSIKNTSGVPEDRVVIRTKLRLANRSWMIDLSLTDRSNMTFALIVGRTALKNHSIAVDTRRTLITRPRPEKCPTGRKDFP